MLMEKCLEKCAVWGGGKEVCGSGGLCGGSVQKGTACGMVIEVCTAAYCMCGMVRK